MTDTYEPKNLVRWTHPDSYIGECWPNYYSAGFGQSRDSGPLERSNFETAKKALLALDDPDKGEVQVVCENHWAVGWVEWIAIHQDNTEALKVADDLVEQYNSYPCLDEEHYSQLETDEANTTWKWMSLKDRIDLCKRFDISIFQARFDYIPDNDGDLFEYLRGD